MNKILKNTLLMIVYGLGGFCFSKTLIYLLENSMNRTVIDTIKIIIYFSPVFILLISITVLIYSIYLSHKIKKDNYNDEEESYYYQHKIHYNLTDYFNEAAMALSFIVFCFNISSPLNDIYQKLVIVNSYSLFIVITLCITTQVILTRLTRKVRPDFNADIFAVNYPYQAYQKLDEMEKSTIGDAAYRTYSWMAMIFIVVLIVTFLFMVVFNINPVIILPVGFLWFVQTTIFTYLLNKKKHKKSKEKPTNE